MARGLLVGALLVAACHCSRPETLVTREEPTPAARAAPAPERGMPGGRDRAAEPGGERAAEPGGERTVEFRREEQGSLPPLQASGPWVEVALKGEFEPAIVGLPLGARSPKPVTVVAHGAGDNPTWQCEWWRKAMGSRAFVVCPRGKPSAKLPSGNMGYVFTGESALKREVSAALDAVRERYGAYVDRGPALYMGFSQGAIYGVNVVASEGKVFRRAVLIEGGYYGTGFTPTSAERFAKAGGERVLFACGVGTCERSAQKAAEYLNKAGVEARVVYAPGAGHTYWGTGVEREVFGALGWVLEGDERY